MSISAVPFRALSSQLARKTAIAPLRQELLFNTVQFSGKFARKRLPLLALAVAMLGMALPGAAQSIPKLQRRIGRARDEVAMDTIDDVKLNVSPINQSLVDLTANPLLSESTRQSLLRTLAQMQDSGKMPMAFWIINQSAPASPEKLQQTASNLLKELGMEKEGIVALWNAQAIREGHFKEGVSLVAGQNVAHELAKVDIAQQIIEAHTLPALKSGNYDKAAQETVKAIQEFVKTGKTDKVSIKKELTQGQKQAIGLIAGAYVLLLGAAFARDVQQGDDDLPRTRLMLEVLRIILMAMSKSSSSGGSRRSGGGFSSGGGRGW